MKKFLFASLLSLTSYYPSLSAETLKVVYNPFTGKLDYITTLSSTTLPSGSTYYIQNTSSLQSGATFYVSSGTVSDMLTVISTMNIGGANMLETSQVQLLMISTKNVLIDGRTNTRQMDRGVFRFLHTPAIENTRTITYEIDVNSMANTHATVAEITATGLASDESAVGHDVNMITADSSGGVMSGIEISKSGTGSAEVHGLHANPGVFPIVQKSGTFGAIEQAWDYNGSYADVTTALGSAGTDVTLFDADNDELFIGMAATFDLISVTLDTSASNPGIKPEFYYSTGGTGGFSLYTPTDDTQGFRTDGLILWDSNYLTGWTTQTENGVGSKYWIKIKRTQNSLGTAPIEDTIKVQTSTEYDWDENGSLSVNAIDAAGVVTIATHAILTDGKITINELGIGMEWKLNSFGANNAISHAFYEYGSGSPNMWYMFDSATINGGAAKERNAGIVFKDETGSTVSDDVGTLFVIEKEAEKRVIIFQGPLALYTTNQVQWFDSDSSHYVSFKASNTVTANSTYVLPASTGAAGTVLYSTSTSNGAQNITWGTIPRDLIRFPATSSLPISSFANVADVIKSTEASKLSKLLVAYDDTADECRQFIIHVSSSVDLSGNLDITVPFMSLSTGTGTTAWYGFYNSTGTGGAPYGAYSTMTGIDTVSVSPSTGTITYARWSTSLGGFGIAPDYILVIEICRDSDIDGDGDTLIGDALVPEYIFSFPLIPR